MVRRRILVGSCAAVIGAFLAAQAVLGDTLPSRRTVLTFNTRVALPYTTLEKGSYSFELANPYSSDHAVIVMNRERTRVFFLGLTRNVERPATLSEERVMTFGEAPRGEAAPIVAWYPTGETRGYEFIYPAR